MNQCVIRGCLAVCGLAAAVHGQQVVYTIDNEDVENLSGTKYLYDIGTAPSIGVNGSIAVVAGSHRMHLFSKANPPVQLASVGYTRVLPAPPNPGFFPFVPVEPPMFGEVFPSLVFPRAEYDPYTGRLWLATTHVWSRVRK